MFKLLSIALAGAYLFYLFQLSKKFKSELKVEDDNNSIENVKKIRNVKLKLMAFNFMGLIVLFGLFVGLMFIKKTFNL